MSINTKAVNRVLKDWVTKGIYISLHSSQPSSSGSPMLFGPARVPSGQVRIQNGAITNPTLINLGQATRSGRATHVGIWLSRSLFFGSSKLTSPVIVTRGSQVQVPRNTLRVGMSNG